MVLEDTEATKSAVLECRCLRQGRQAYIHVAKHGFFAAGDARSPLNSANRSGLEPDAAKTSPRPPFHWAAFVLAWQHWR